MGMRVEMSEPIVGGSTATRGGGGGGHGGRIADKMIIGCRSTDTT